MKILLTVKKMKLHGGQLKICMLLVSIQVTHLIFAPYVNRNATIDEYTTIQKIVKFRRRHVFDLHMLIVYSLLVN